MNSDELVASPGTKSDKIRALARAGYLRTEIAKALGIRYQHVRKVLVDAGIKEGLQRRVQLERSPDVIEASSAERRPTPPIVLEKAGFVHAGAWSLVDGKITLVADVPAVPGVYAFVLEDVVVYVGVTQNGLKTRMDQYRRGHARQRTSARVNGLIREALLAGTSVSVFVTTPPELQWNGLPIDGSAGLEVGLIKMIQPIWNMRGIR